MSDKCKCGHLLSEHHDGVICVDEGCGCNLNCDNYTKYGFDCFSDENVTREAKFVHPVCVECKEPETDWVGLSKISENDLFGRWWSLERSSYSPQGAKNPDDYKEVGREAFDTARKPLKAGIKLSLEQIGKHSHLHRCRGLECHEECATKIILDSILKEVK